MTGSDKSESSAGASPPTWGRSHEVHFFRRAPRHRKVGAAEVTPARPWPAPARWASLAPGITWTMVLVET